MDSEKFLKIQKKKTFKYQMNYEEKSKFCKIETSRK